MRRILLSVALGAVGLRAAPARACGQSTHVWIGLHAVEHLPPGELRDLLAGEEHRLQLVNGAMFPDGGYSPIVRDDYGEMAHWEPFQTSLLDHVRAEHGWPLDADGEDEAAFLFGLAAHGMADQVFDGVYLTRSQVYDAEGWQTYSVDTSSDVVLVAREGPAEVLDRWAPWDLLVELFAQAGHTVDADTMMSGQGSLQVALRAVAISAADPETEAEYESQFPWAHAHMLDPSVPGSPACIGEVVAAYWQTMWDRLQGRFDMDADPVISTWPEAGSAGHPLAAADIEARVSLVFSRAIDASTLPERIVVTDAAGEVVPTDARLYYGDGSNVLNLWPLQDWVDGETYTVVVSEGLTSFDGVVLGAPWAMTFMAGAAPAAPVAGCGCASGGSGGAAIGVGLAVALRRRRAAAVG